MDFSRRGFIGILGAAASAPRLFAKAPSDYDPDLTVLLSDIHVNGVERDVVYQRDKVLRLHGRHGCIVRRGMDRGAPRLPEGDGVLGQVPELELQEIRFRDHHAEGPRVCVPFSVSDDGGATWTVLDKVEDYDTTTDYNALAYSKRIETPLPPAPGGVHGKWLGGNGGNRFSVAANWDDGEVPGAGDALDFSSVTSAPAKFFKVGIDYAVEE